jgi:hypothetical protein
MEGPHRPRYVLQVLGSLLIALLLVLAAGGIASAALSSTAECGTSSSAQDDG